VAGVDQVSAPDPSRWSDWQSTGTQPIVGRLRQAVVVLLVIVAALGGWLRFKASSLLWLDEAQSVNIAKHPLHQIPSLLKEDGAPPLYYFLLHLWMQLFGSSDVAVRSLSGLISVATVLVAYLVARRVWGVEIAVIAAVFLTASPFACYYATETRMYALVMLLMALAVGALSRLFESPSLGWLLAVAALATALEYTQYWTFYLFATIGIWMLLSAIIAPRSSDRRAARSFLVALAVAAVAFLPWLPDFLYQRSHTGTPWGSPPNFLTAAVAVFHFHANQALQVPRSDLRQRAMELIFIVLFVLALFGSQSSTRRLRINPKTEPRGRFLAWVVFATLVLGVVASHYTNNAYAPRYGSIVYVPLMIYLAVGVQFFRPAWLRVLLAAAIAAGFLIGSFQESETQRSQAGQVLAVLAANAEPGDVAIFCPDELGPTVLRIMPRGLVNPVGYPRFTRPDIVDWIDYDRVLGRTSPTSFVDRAAARARGHRLWLVWSPGYGASGPACTRLAQVLAEEAGWTGKVWVDPEPQTYFQSMQLIEYSRAS
jgi:4-amino-4-deoxy-L-arabinose transferase-like glycosyltransferase